MNLNKRDAAGVVVLIIIVIVRLGLNGGSVLTACSTSTLLLAAAMSPLHSPSLSTCPKVGCSHHLRRNHRRQE
jgi:hypothetical protein